MRNHKLKTQLTKFNTVPIWQLPFPPCEARAKTVLTKEVVAEVLGALGTSPKKQLVQCELLQLNMLETSSQDIESKKSHILASCIFNENVQEDKATPMSFAEYVLETIKQDDTFLNDVLFSVTIPKRNNKMK